MVLAACRLGVSIRKDPTRSNCAYASHAGFSLCVLLEKQA